MSQQNTVTMAMMPDLRTSWAIADESKAQPSVRVEQRPLGSDAQIVAVELSLNELPWRLEKGRGDDTDDDAKRSCELVLAFESHPLQCKTLQLQLTSSARHIELHVEGIRRSLLGEDEKSDVYFGTFRGKKAAAHPPPAAGATQYFDVAEEFKQATRDHDVLKCIHKLRIKFVSLTGDKSALELTNFQCLYIATAAPPPGLSGLPTASESAMPSQADVVGMMAGLSAADQGMSPQLLLQMVQQMLEREVEAKITRALDAKLSVLAQRLSFSEQMLLQVQQKTSAKDSLLESRLNTLQQQVAELRGQVVKPSDDEQLHPEATKQPEAEAPEPVAAAKQPEAEEE